MAPFLPPKTVFTGLKDRAESLTVQGDRLYIGTATGNLHVLSINDVSNGEGDALTLVEVKKNLTRRAIEQLLFLKEINSLVVLSESAVTLYPIPSLSPPTPLAKAKSAFSIAAHSSVQNVTPTGTVERLMKEDEDEQTKSVPMIVTQLVVACRRKLVIYSWNNGEAQDPKETPLPHSPRSMVFLNPDTIGFAYSPTEYAIFSVTSLSATDISTPLPAISSVTGMGALSGLTGYMTLGLGTKAKPGLVQINDSELLIIKDNQGFVVGADAKLSRTNAVDWPAPPDELCSTAFVKPYICSILPPGSVLLEQGSAIPNSTTSQPTTIPSPVIQIRSSISLLPTQTLTFPFLPGSPNSSTVASHTARLLTSSSGARAPLFLITTPIDRTLATAEGSTIWQLRMKPWADQVDEMVNVGRYSDALELLGTIDLPALPDKEQRIAHARSLNAVSQFKAGKFDEAIDTLDQLNINPAKVVALFPASISGRLAAPRENWIPLYGGPVIADDTSSTASEENKEPSEEKSMAELLEAAPPPTTVSSTAGFVASTTGTIRGKLKSGLGVFMPSGVKDDDTASISSKRKFSLQGDFKRSADTLKRYLPDYRRKVAKALAAVSITPAQRGTSTPLSEIPVEDILALPNAPPSSLRPDQLIQFAQIVDTALFKLYLIIQSPLLGSLCRIPNWCEVSEVEEDLRTRQKYSDLIDLYNGKNMHEKALALLKQLSESETDNRDKVGPSITYLQKLGPEYLPQIFKFSRWILDLDRDLGFEIFTSEDVELPRNAVADYLESVDPRICARYLEYLIEERKEESSGFHDRLAELYLHMTLRAAKSGDESTRSETYSKLLHFIDTTEHYSTSRVYGIISSEDLFEARAILLGRLGRHDQALEMYVYRIQDFRKAEEYCKRIYQPGTDTSSIFLTLLRIYLRPTIKISFDLLQPALDLISRHSRRIDSVESLQLLPPLVTAKDVRAFLLEALRAPIFDSRVIRESAKARNDQIARKLVLLQSKRVKVTDSRICPQCSKRIGSSVIAVHSPRGEVTHYQCREAFSQRLHDIRR